MLYFNKFTLVSKCLHNGVDDKYEVFVILNPLQYFNRRQSVYICYTTRKNELIVFKKLSFMFLWKEKIDS